MSVCVINSEKFSLERESSILVQLLVIGEPYKEFWNLDNLNNEQLKTAVATLNLFMEQVVQYNARQIK